MTTGRIVVGVDSSAEAQKAIQWAVAEARLRGANLEAVHAWRSPVFANPGGLVAVPVLPETEMEEYARAELDQALGAALGDGAADLDVERVVQEGGAAETLVEHAAGADLLVVGHRGRGGFTGLLLGSVAQQVSSHAPCPVVVVR